VWEARQSSRQAGKVAGRYYEAECMAGNGVKVHLASSMRVSRVAGRYCVFCIWWYCLSWQCQCIWCSQVSGSVYIV